MIPRFRASKCGTADSLLGAHGQLEFFRIRREGIRLFYKLKKSAKNKIASKSKNYFSSQKRTKYQSDSFLRESKSKGPSKGKMKNRKGFFPSIERKISKNPKFQEFESVDRQKEIKTFQVSQSKK